MIRFILIALLCAPFAAGAAGADKDPAPKADIRMARELQARAWGSPSLSAGAERPELALALAELGLAAQSEGSLAAGGLDARDYDALFALLQRYRDDLLRLGLQNSELDAQLQALRLRSAELKERLDKLKPKDGLKIHARIYSVFDDLHLLGPMALPSPGSVAKPALAGTRFQVGLLHSELRLEGTRGPLSAYIQYDFIMPFGLRNGVAGLRRVYSELRLPVTLQFGDIDLGLSPLTLWRNDEYQPFEPEPFRGRRARLRDDMLLVPDKWPVQGARASTEMTLFGAQRLEAENTLFVAGYSKVEIYKRSPKEANISLAERYNTFGNAWRVTLPLFNAVRLSNHGLLFWDETATNPGTSYKALNFLVYSGQAEFSSGIFRAGAEYAAASYALPVSTTYTPSVAPLTGTALTYHAGIVHGGLKFNAFGRMVDRSFSSPGAQGRTVDEAWQYLGPFATEQSQVNVAGGIGVFPPAIPVNHSSRVNDRLIPAGVMDATKIGTAGAFGSYFGHLLDYGVLENPDPYGAATPNRSGYGAEFEWSLLDGGIKPLATYETYSHRTPASDLAGPAGNTIAAFTMNRMRAGLFIDLKPMLGWPLRFQGGYTTDQSSNGGKNAAGKDYSLSSALLEGGAEWDFIAEMGLTFGYRHFDIKGLNDKFNFSALPQGQTYDTLGAGMWWEPMKDVRFDLMYSQLNYNAPEVLNANWEADQGVARMTIQF